MTDEQKGRDCPDCHGQGDLRDYPLGAGLTCPTCKGKGFLSAFDKETLLLREHNSRVIRENPERWGVKDDRA